MLGRTILLAGIAALAACPAPAPTPQPGERKDPSTDERVIRLGNDYYAKRDVERNLDEKRGQAGPGRGSGKPDETNGVCRLYAPKLPNPECCNVEYGFDADRVRRTCGFPTYLGESFHYSCGYYFHRPNGAPAWFRMSFVPGKTPMEAARSHDRKLQRLTRRSPSPASPSEPVPGVPGAYWSFHDGLAWAFVPGWDKVRQLTWRDEFCDREKVARIIGALVQAKPPPPGAKRLGLVPRAR